MLLTFPKRTQREAAEALGSLLEELSALDELSAKLSAEDEAGKASTPARTGTGGAAELALAATAAAARARAKGLTDLYYTDGCMVCADDTRSRTDGDVAASRIKKLKEFEPRLNRRPDRNDNGAVFRNGDVFGGYD